MFVHYLDEIRTSKFEQHNAPTTVKDVLHFPVFHFNFPRPF
jgi:hypothetical protein